MNIDGTWDVSTSGPMGEGTAVMVLAESDGVVTGTYDEFVLEGGQLKDGVLTWEATFTHPMKARVKATGRVEGDSISGEARPARLPIPVKVKWTATRRTTTSVGGT